MFPAVRRLRRTLTARRAVNHVKRGPTTETSSNGGRHTPAETDRRRPSMFMELRRWFCGRFQNDKRLMISWRGWTLEGAQEQPVKDIGVKKNVLTTSNQTCFCRSVEGVQKYSTNSTFNYKKIFSRLQHLQKRYSTFFFLFRFCSQHKFRALGF